MTGSWVRRLTWSKFAIAVSVGLIIFGTLVAVLPRQTTSVPPPMPIPGGRPGGVAVGASARASAAQQVAAQQVAVQQTAEQFVTACDTTDPLHPTGDIATETELAPALAFPHAATWPALWTAEGRHTTVVLGPPGQPMAESGGQVAVIVTGVMTVTSDAGPPAAVPVTEKVTLRPSPAGSGSSGWLVTGLEVGA